MRFPVVFCVYSNKCPRSNIRPFLMPISSRNHTKTDYFSKFSRLNIGRIHPCKKYFRPAYRQLTTLGVWLPHPPGDNFQQNKDDATGNTKEEHWKYTKTRGSLRQPQQPRQPRLLLLHTHSYSLSLLLMKYLMRMKEKNLNIKILNIKMLPVTLFCWAF